MRHQPLEIHIAICLFFKKERKYMIRILYLKWIKKKCRHFCRFCKYTKYCDLYILEKSVDIWGNKSIINNIRKTNLADLSA